MKFRTYLETITGISIYPMISLLIFFSFFVGLIWYVFRLDRKKVDRIGNIPLEDGTIKKGALTFLAFIGIPLASMAQSSTGQSGSDLLMYFVLSILIVMAFILVVILFQVLDLLKKVSGNAVAAETEATEYTGLFSEAWWRKFGGFSVPLRDERRILIEGHEYDGIQELDNRMPPWLKFLFNGTIVFAIVYVIYYHSGSGDLQQAELDKEIAAAEVQKKAFLEKVGASIDENSVTLLSDAAALEQGKAIFTEKCAACHAADGGGGVGPNLTDNYWLHGGDIKDVFKIVKYGVPQKGMISWEKQLSPPDIQKVSSYIHTLLGTTPAAPKEPQGELYESSPETPASAVAADSTVALR